MQAWPAFESQSLNALPHGRQGLLCVGTNRVRHQAPERRRPMEVRTRARMALTRVKDTLQRLVHACGYHVSRLPAPVASFEPARSPEPRVCHYEQLFVSHRGDLFPCCDTWNRSALRIGHLDEPDLIEKIRRFRVPCTLCGAYTLRAAKQDEPARVTGINIETSLACQAQCVMCCVEAPAWRGHYEYYDTIVRLVGQLRPARLLRSSPRQHASRNGHGSRAGTDAEKRSRSHDSSP